MVLVSTFYCNKREEEKNMTLAHEGVNNLVAHGTITLKDCEYLKNAVYHAQNILVVGACGSGKTTFLEALAGCIPEESTVALLQRVPGIIIERDNILHYEQHTGDFGDILTLLLTEDNPNYIVLDDLEKNTANKSLRGMGQWNKTILTSLHGKTHLEGINNFVQKALAHSPSTEKEDDIKSAIGDGVDLVVLLEITKSGRRIAKLQRLTGYNINTEEFVLQDI